ncbi:hypothetical protein C2G38_2149714 [Gigaspora rosea]|uniref:F-box domain-containing protein n=1 Tax=Gigaspora rosea TaxID=44941 RepID=A0A397U1Z2_9GLOM|nr:hypothetical protein C2G38_2149714 [Gigaspora rosea]
MAVPILWQDPFSSVRSPLFISKYFSSLGKDEKFILKECLEELGINEEFSNTLFDYARFLKVLDLWKLESKVIKWITFKLIDSELFYDTEMYHIINLLFKLFIESGAALHKLGLGFSKSLELKPEIFYILGENKQFFSRIQHLSLDEISDNNIESSVALLRALAKSTKKISAIELNYFDLDYEPQIFQALIYVIKSQEQLRLFSLVGGYHTEFYGVISALESQKNLLQVILDNCDFSAEFEVFNNCKNLETLRIRHCATEPLKLLDYKVSTLEVIESQIDTQSMALIFEKSETNHIINLLIKLFIESGGTLHKLDLRFPISLELKPVIFYLLGENKQFFSRIQHLFLGKILDNIIERATTLLEALAKSTTKISTIKLQWFESIYEPQIFYALINIIKSQEQLRLFFLAGVYPTEFHGIISALESQKNSLQEVILDNCDFSAEFEVLNKCKNLKTLRIGHCTTKLLKLLDYKVSTLEVVDFHNDDMPLIFEKSGKLLQRLRLVKLEEEFQDKPLLLEALKSFCPNITYLSIQGIGFSTQLVVLIGNLQKLQFLSLRCDDVDDIPEEVLKIRVIQFSETLPLTLKYFNLGDTWLEPYTDILFNYCNAPLKKMLIYRLNKERISKALVEFCMRNKTLNYVGVYKYFDLDNDIRKEVEIYVELVPCEYIVVDL